VIAGNLNATGLSLSGNVVSGIATTANITGGNVIAVSAASAVSVVASGNVTGGNILTAGLISATGNLVGGNVLGGANVNATTHTGTTVSVTGNITGGNVLGGANVNATTHTGTTVSVTGNTTGGNINTPGIFSGAGNVQAWSTTTPGLAIGGLHLGSASATTNAGPAITFGGRDATSGTVAQAGIYTNTDATYGTKMYFATTDGYASGSKVAVSIDQLGIFYVNARNGITAINNSGSNGVGNIGTTTSVFNTVFAKATSAQYADLAEWYTADADYEPGTVLVFGGDQEVTQAIGINDVRVAGVVSTNPAHIMNSGLKAPHIAAVALTGRVPTLVVGPVTKGDMMVTAGGGRAQACAEPRMGSVIGKALQDHPGGQGTIEIVVGRM
jgi:hypothetical protein